MFPSKKKLLYKGKQSRNAIQKRQEQLTSKISDEHLSRLEFLKNRIPVRGSFSESRPFYASEHSNDHFRVFSRLDEALMYQRWSLHHLLRGDFEQSRMALGWAQRNMPLDLPVLCDQLLLLQSIASRSEEALTRHEADEIWHESDSYNPLQHIWKDD
jgi:hypothetical protein